MSIFEWFKKKRKKIETNSEKVVEQNEGNLFDNVPFLAPWHFLPEKPNLKIQSLQLRWHYVEKHNGGITTLNKGETVLGLVDTYTYVMPLPSGDEFCIWTRANHNEELSRTLEIYSTESLNEINHPLEKMKELRANNEKSYSPFGYLFNGIPKSKTTIILSPEKDVISHSFPPEFYVYGEIILVLNIPGLYKEKEDSWQDCALVSVKPCENKIQIYPQDWFNKDTEIDFGYQWITRAFRNVNTGSIFVEGIRLPRFELDASNRKIK